MWALAGILMVFWCGFGEISLEAWVCKARFCGSAVIRVTLSQQKLLFATVVQYHGGPNTRRHHPTSSFIIWLFIFYGMCWAGITGSKIIRGMSNKRVDDTTAVLLQLRNWNDLDWLIISILQISANGYRTMLVS